MFEIGKLGRLTLGYVNENEARVIDIDMTGWLEDFPDGNIGLLVKRPWEDNYYPADLKREGNVVIWKPTRADMMIDGEGEAQFVLTNAEGVELRSRVVGTKINASLGGTAGDKPNPSDSFVQTVINAAAQAESAVKKMPSVGENGNWYAWDAAAGAYVDTGKPSRGEQGYTPKKGVDYRDGVDGKTPVRGVDYWTEEDKQSIVDEVLAEIPEGGLGENVTEETNTYTQLLADLEKAVEDLPDDVGFETDATLTLENGILSVNTADVVEEDNTLPVTSAAVYTEVGNINALLGTI